MIVAAAIFLLGVQAIYAQTPTPSTAQTKAAATDELETLAQQWMQAAQDHDVSALERLMASDFTLVHPSQDKVTTRAEWLAALSRIQTKRFQHQHLKVLHYGQTVAVVSAVLRIDAEMDGQPWPAPKTAVTDVWEKRGGKWQVVTRYAVRPEEIKSPSTASAPMAEPPKP
jgi:ketosteroid isomerase-like protein